MEDTTIQVELTVRETRALARCAGLLSSVLTDEASVLGDGPCALVTGIMKLEVALVIEGAEW